MATYAELSDLSGSNVLLDRVTVAITIAAINIVSEAASTTNNAKRLVWAKSAFINPSRQSKPFLNALLAANAGVTVANINSVTDAQIQTQVASVINIFSGV